ncbi:MAG: hypothetical protein AAB297_03900 [Acidobacteriota bacterium]
MQNARNQGRTGLPGVLLLAAALTSTVSATEDPRAAVDLAAGPAAAGPAIDPPALIRALALMHPDYSLYISSVRALPAGVSRRLYMALVRPGADDPAGRDSAPLAGAGARNDIVYDQAAIVAGHSPAWRSLLLAHEYFHARHLAEATLLPVARGSGVEIERHYNEAAAWGFNVAEARAGRYTGLRPDEFREALDRYGEHYAALKALLKKKEPERWRRIAELMLQPDALFTTAGSPPPASLSRPSGLGQSSATP